MLVALRKAFNLVLLLQNLTQNMEQDKSISETQLVISGYDQRIKKMSSSTKMALL